MKYFEIFIDIKAEFIKIYNKYLIKYTNYNIYNNYKYFLICYSKQEKKKL